MWDHKVHAQIQNLEEVKTKVFGFRFEYEHIQVEKEVHQAKNLRLCISRVSWSQNFVTILKYEYRFHHQCML